jgi:hypothetical protein
MGKISTTADELNLSSHEYIVSLLPISRMQNRFYTRILPSGRFSVPQAHPAGANGIMHTLVPCATLGDFTNPVN